MKLDDPKLTAFALGELPPAERQQLEAELAAHPEFVAEVDETQEIAGILRNGLRGEPAGELAPHQRDAIFRAAHLAQPTTVPANERPAPLVLPKAKWWDRPGPWQAIAACAVLALGVFATNVNFSKSEGKGQMADLGEISVAVPTDAVAATANAGDPELLSPKQGDTPPSIGRTEINPAKTLVQSPDIKRTPPNVEIGAPSAFAGNSAQTSRGPHVIGVRNPELAGADIGRSANRPNGATVTDALIADSVKVLMKEAGRVKEGGDYANFEQVFRPVLGIAGRYEMIRCPSIKVDVEFATADGQPLTTPPTPESRIKKVSKPYLETE
jgi:hypothetical protein